MSKVKSQCNRQKNVKSENNNPSIGSWANENEDVSTLAIGDLNDISRWICMMQQSKNINVAFLHILKEIEKNITERIDVFQRELESKIESKIEMKFDAKKQPQTVFSNANLKELVKELGVTFPLQDFESFEAFNNDLESDPGKQDALRELLLCRIDSMSTPTRDLYKLMNYVLAESVQIKYTWIGKKFRGQQKENFSLTNVYLCMEDVLTRKHKETRATLKLNTKFSNYFSRVNFKNKSINSNNNPK